MYKCAKQHHTMIKINTVDYMTNKYRAIYKQREVTRGPRLTSHKHNNKDLSRLRINARYRGQTERERQTDRDSDKVILDYTRIKI